MKQSPVFSDVEKLKKLMEYLPKMEYSQLVEFVSPEEMKKALDEMFNVVSEDKSMEAAVDSAIETATSVAPTTTENKSEDTDIDALLGMI